MRVLHQDILEEGAFDQPCQVSYKNIFFILFFRIQEVVTFQRIQKRVLRVLASWTVFDMGPTKLSIEIVRK